MSATKMIESVHTCHTQMRVVNFAQKWTIDFFSLRCSAKNDKTSHPFISSAEFWPAQCDQPKFHIQLYPRGRNDECKEYVSVFVFLKSFDLSELNAKCSISILDVKGDKCKTWETQYEFVRDGQGWGKPKFAPLAYILNGANKLLPDDKLTIYCEISYNNSVTVSGTEVELHDLCESSQRQMIEDMGDLLDSGKLSDVTLRVGSAKFKLHKAVLAARSSVFAVMFTVEAGENRVNRVDISNVTDVEVFRQFVRYIYTGKVESIDNFAAQLLPLAEKYAMANLKLMCEQCLATKLSPESAIDTFILADLHNATQLKSAAVQYIACYASSVVGTKSWNNMLETKPKLINQVFQHIVKYPDCKKRKST